MDKQLPEIVKQTLLNKRAELMAERVRLVRDVDLKIAEIDAFLGEGQEAMSTASALPIFSTSSDDEASMTRKIKDMAKRLIVPGVHVTTENIYKALLAEGVVMPPMEGKPETARITRILSGTKRADTGEKLYKGHKTLGWSLKGKEPVAAGS